MSTISAADQRLRLARELLPSEERKKVIRSLDFFNDEANLLGQLPETTILVENFTEDVSRLFKEADATVRTILGNPVFEKFIEFMLRGAMPIGKNLNEVLINHKTPYLGVNLWSFNPGNNRNISLVFATNKKLLACTDMYHYQTEDSLGFHWKRCDTHCDDEQGLLKVDNYRMMLALKVLANPETAWTYLRARAFMSEVIS